jgi:hypothetical protein
METELINQFVSEVISYSSQLNDTDHSAKNIIGQPTSQNVYGKISESWSPVNFSEKQHIEVKFERAVFATEIKIFQNYIGGSVVKIEVLNESTYETLWRRQRPKLITQYTIFKPKFIKSRVRSNQYRITFDYLPLQQELSEIEAIELIGTSTNIQVTNGQLADDIPKLLYDFRYIDFKISFKNETEALNAHQLILSVRTPQFLNYLIKNDNQITELTSIQFSVILDYIYTDQLNEDKLDDVIDEEKSKSTNETHPEICDLSLNRLIRFTIKHKFPILESLITDYLTKNVLNNENVLPLLVDSMKGNIDKTNKIRLEDNYNIDLDEITIDLVHFSCMEYISANAAQIFEGENINSIGKDDLIKIVNYIAEQRNK